MHLLDTLTILCAGLMTGNELAVSLFVNPVIWQLEDRAQMRALSLFASLLGKVMPFWYFSCLILLGLEAYLRRHETALPLLLAAVILWAAIIVYTISVLVPINNRIARLQAALPEGWQQAHKKWDMLHRLRILLLIVALSCFIYGVLG